MTSQFASCFVSCLHACRFPERLWLDAFGSWWDMLPRARMAMNLAVSVKVEASFVHAKGFVWVVIFGSERRRPWVACAAEFA